MRRTLLNRRIGRILQFRFAALRQGLSEAEAMDLWFRRMQPSSEQSDHRHKWSGASPEIEFRASHYSRRKALGLMGVGLGAGLAGCVVRRDLGSGKLKSQSDGQSPVVIIGAGLAGLTCAYRLIQQGRKVVLYEASERVGGRVYTQKNFNGSGQFVELGAELVDSSNVELLRLVKELGLAAIPFSSDAMYSDEELFFFEGSPRTSDEFYKALGPLLSHVALDLEKIFGNSGAYFPNYKSLNRPSVVAADKTSLKDYFQGLRDHADSWVVNALALAFETEYGGALETQSSLNFLSLADTNLSDGFSWYGASDEWGRVDGGNSRLCSRLLEEVSQSADVFLNHALEAAQFDGQKFRIEFRIVNGGSATTRSLEADQIVLAIPFSVVREIDGLESLVSQFSPMKQKSIAEFSYGTNAKFMTSYNSRYWRKDHSGSRFPKSQAAVLSDLPTGQYWETSRAQVGPSGTIRDSDHGILTNFLGGELGAKVHMRQSEHLNQILQDVDSLWPGCKKNFDKNAVLKAWPSEPFSRGSYSSPGLGQYTGFIGVEAEPELGGRIHFAGEHTSQEWLGYMEGAIESGTRVAQAILAKA